MLQFTIKSQPDVTEGHWLDTFGAILVDLISRDHERRPGFWPQKALGWQHDLSSSDPDALQLALSALQLLHEAIPDKIAPPKTR